MIDITIKKILLICIISHQTEKQSAHFNVIFAIPFSSLTSRCEDKANEGVQKCGHTLVPRDQKLGVYEHFVAFYTLCIKMPYGKAYVCPTDIHRKFFSPGVMVESAQRKSSSNSSLLRAVIPVATASWIANGKTEDVTAEVSWNLISLDISMILPLIVSLKNGKLVSTCCKLCHPKLS